MITAIKCILGFALEIGGIYVQHREQSLRICNFILGTEAVIAGIIIIATA